MFPKWRILDPKPRRVEGPKSATERSHEGGANVAAAICRFPARDMPFARMILGIFTVNLSKIPINALKQNLRVKGKGNQNIMQKCIGG